MVTQEQQQITPLVKTCDSSEYIQNGMVTCIPESWELTPQQRAFIEMCAEDELPKQ